MGLAAEVRAAPRRMTRQHVNMLLGDDDATELDELLHDRSVPPQLIWRALRNRDVHVSSRTVAYWASEARSR